MVDANQAWDVDQAIDWMQALAPSRPLVDRGADQPRRHPRATPASRAPSSRWGSASRPASTARTGSCSSSSCRPSAIGFCQIDSCRLGGVNEVLAVLLLAAKFGVPVCPHAGGVGLCEYVQHLAIFDYIAVSGSLEDRVVEYVDHLHEHFVAPVVVRDGRYVAPTAPGYSITMRPESLERFAFPGGDAWTPAGVRGVRAHERPARRQGLPDHRRRLRHRAGDGARCSRPRGRGSRSPTSTRAAAAETVRLIEADGGRGRRLHAST